MVKKQQLFMIAIGYLVETRRHDCAFSKPEGTTWLPRIKGDAVRGTARNPPLEIPVSHLGSTVGL